MSQFEVNKAEMDAVVRIDALSKISSTNWYVAICCQDDAVPVCGHDYVLDNVPGVEEGTLCIYTYTRIGNDDSPIWLNRIKSSPALALLFDTELERCFSVIGEAVGWFYVKDQSEAGMREAV